MSAFHCWGLQAFASRGCLTLRGDPRRLHDDEEELRIDLLRAASFLTILKRLCHRVLAIIKHWILADSFMLKLPFDFVETRIQKMKPFRMDPCLPKFI